MPDYIQLIPSGGRPSSHELLKMEIGRHWEAEAETETDDKRSQFIDEVSYQESCVDFDEASCRAPPLQVSIKPNNRFHWVKPVTFSLLERWEGVRYRLRVN